MNKIVPATEKKVKIPKLADLYANTELTVKNNELNIVLNSPPKKEWVRVNSMAGNSKYIPIGIIEYLLTSIFVKWRVEIKNTKLVANSVSCEIRLHVLDPVTGEWDWQDGVGAMPLQTDKGAGATDFSKVKSSSVQMAMPGAESYAIKDAAEKFGKIFGKDLNRKDGVGNYASLLSKEVSESNFNKDDFSTEVVPVSFSINKIKQCKSLKALNGLKKDFEEVLKTEHKYSDVQISGIYKALTTKLNELDTFKQE